jgi:hypothetical protein
MTYLLLPPTQHQYALDAEAAFTQEGSAEILDVRAAPRRSAVDPA